jgi:hypothetical protein
LVTTRPFRTPQHTVSDVGRVGGGHMPMPGDVSMAPNSLPCEIDAVRVHATVRPSKMASQWHGPWRSSSPLHGIHRGRRGPSSQASSG